MKHLFIVCCLLTTVAVSNAQSKNEKEMKHQSTEIIRYVIPADRHAEFETAYAAAAQYLKQSVYCLGYQVLHGDEEPDNYIIVIQWTSKEDHLNGFRNSEQFQSFFRFVRPFYSNIQEMKHYNRSEIQWNR